MEIQVRGSLSIKESEVFGGWSFDLYKVYAYHSGKADMFLGKDFLSRILDVYYNVGGDDDHVIYSDSDCKKVITFDYEDYGYKVTVRKREIPDILNHLRDEYNFFYDPNRKELEDDVKGLSLKVEELEDFRSDICGVLDIDSMIGSTRQNDKRILEQVERLKKIEHEHYHVINNWYKESYLEEVLNDLCDENNVVRPCNTRNYKERLEYIFEVLTNWRKRAVRAEHEHDECIKANTKDYANAKVARAELAYLYKRILGEERLDPKLSPHEVAVAIIKHVQGLCDLQHEANMGVKELQKFRDEVYNTLNLGYPTTNNHILTVLRTRLEKLDADGPWVAERYITDLIRENSTKFKVLQPLNYMTIEERMRYTFEALYEWRDRALEAERQLVDAQVAASKFRNNIRGALGFNIKEGCTDAMVEELVKNLNRMKNQRDNELVTIYHELELDPTASDSDDILDEIKKLKKAATKNDFYREDFADLVGLARYSSWSQIYEKIRGVLNDNNSIEYAFTSTNKKYKSLKEFRNDVCEILDIDTCDKDTVVSAIKALKSAYTKLQKDYDELGKAYSSVLKWNNSYSDIRRLLGVSADADAGEMVGALNKIICDHAKLERSLKIAKTMRTESDRRRKMWHSRYESEHERANGEHKKAEKLNKEVRDWTKRCDSLGQALNAKSNEEVGLSAFKNECRKLRDEKAKVIKALGQDIWDDCLK